ncbi:uncharacterized protein LOC131852137 isoform X1 [Achroia grisella]|uniref:uncharacterized protein LOC131852137 isoform X1 n=1 Tax=Achroia grisella TaxID=688607 RepID=UPI0027D253D9|nr:uncharacterized protein LOC131852137 isoform X1 [Achroia grisella]XP_059058759.1 uncharacterized protein LOC131852137 isoform X1 [Achroia grisella]
MKTSVYLVAVCAALVAVYAAPAPNPEPNPDPAPQPDPAPSPADDRPEIIEIIAPAASAQETLSTLNLGAPGSDLSERNKRTIGILRQLFPTLTQIIEQKVQQITSVVLQTFGPIVLRTFLGGNRSGGGGNKGGGGGTVELDDDDDDDDDEDATPVSSTTQATTTKAADAGTLRRKRALFFLPNAVADENQLLSGAESQQAEVRVAFGEGQGGQDQQVAASEDQQAAAQTNSASIDEITLDDADTSEENRNKRFLSGGGQNGATGGGSGNFIFDIVRRPAEAMARAAGTAFRLFAGTDSLNVGLSASHTASLDPNNPQLVSGTFASSSADPGAPADGDDASAAKGDNLTEGVPGPITRLFIIANRGIANLIQDLILRIAQTSERIVNFKARLITSII